MFSYIDDKCNYKRLENFVNIEFDNTIKICKYNLNSNNLNELLWFKNRMLEIFKKKISYFNLTLKWAPLYTINNICNDVFNIMHDYQKEFSVNTSYVIILDMQTTLLKKIREILNTETDAR